MERRIIIAGSGGQGILFLGKLITCAAMHDNKEVTWFPSYGAEMRGGTASCTVIVSDEMIGSPVVKNADILIVMNDASYNKFCLRLVPGGTVIYDSSLIVSPRPMNDLTLIPVPASEIASALRNKRSANMALIGSFAALSHLVNMESLLSALAEITPARRKSFLDINKEILMKGYDFAKDSQSGHNRHKKDSAAG
jgi:2-oxoglutarate ferredoxin oxidoreductase subunit gamma